MKHCRLHEKQHGGGKSLHHKEKGQPKRFHHILSRVPLLRNNRSYGIINSGLWWLGDEDFRLVSPERGLNDKGAIEWLKLTSRNCANDYEEAQF